MTIGKGFSRSMKRATVVFTEPGRGRTIVQENEGRVSVKLRTAIAAAREAFWKVYRGPEEEE